MPWGEDHHAAFRGLVGHRMSVGICRGPAREHNRVTLDPVLKDRHGIPAPWIDYTLGENSNRMLDYASTAPRRSSPPPARGMSTSSAPSSTAAGTCSALPAWATTPSARW